MKRYAYRLRVKPGREEEYIRHHANPLPELLKALRESGIRNYSIYMDGTDLFAYMECDDIEQAWAHIRSQPADKEWSRLLTPIMDLVDAGDAEPRMKPMTEVFRLKDQSENENGIDSALSLR